jgi:hypothetical protein
LDEEVPSGRGQLDAAGVPMEELDADLLFAPQFGNDVSAPTLRRTVVARSGRRLPVLKHSGAQRVFRNSTHSRIPGVEILVSGTQAAEWRGTPTSPANSRAAELDDLCAGARAVGDA